MPLPPSSTTQLKFALGPPVTLDLHILLSTGPVIYKRCQSFFGLLCERFIINWEIQLALNYNTRTCVIVRYFYWQYALPSCAMKRQLNYWTLRPTWFCALLVRLSTLVTSIYFILHNLTLYLCSIISSSPLQNTIFNYRLVFIIFKFYNFKDREKYLHNQHNFHSGFNRQSQFLPVNAYWSSIIKGCKSFTSLLWTIRTKMKTK